MDEQTNGTDENYIPLRQTSYAGGIKKNRMSSAKILLGTFRIKLERIFLKGGHSD